MISLETLLLWRAIDEKSFGNVREFLFSNNDLFRNINRIIVFGYKTAVDFMFSAGTGARFHRRVKQFTFIGDGQYFQLYFRTCSQLTTQ